MQNGITCAMLRSLEQLSTAVPAWRALWSADPDATPFQAPEWLLPWARQFAPSDLKIVMVHDRGSLVAILPFYRLLESLSAERQLLLLGAGTSDYLDGIYSMDCTETHIRAALGFICREEDWDVLQVLQLTARGVSGEFPAQC